MGNPIKRDTIFVHSIALVNSNAYNKGDCMGYYKQDGHWYTKDSNGKTWLNFIGNLRNEKLTKIVNQFSMSDIVQYLRDRNDDYYTVLYELLADAVNTTFTETRVCCIDDIYDYVSENLV